MTHSTTATNNNSSNNNNKHINNAKKNNNHSVKNDQNTVDEHQSHSEQGNLVQQFFNTIHSLLPVQQKHHDNIKSVEAEKTIHSHHRNQRRAPVRPIRIPQRRRVNMEDSHVESDDDRVTSLGDASATSPPLSMKTSSSQAPCSMMDLWESHSAACEERSSPRKRSSPVEVKTTTETAARGRRSISKFFKMADLEDSEDDDEEEEVGDGSVSRRNNIESNDGDADDVAFPLVESPRKRSRQTRSSSVLAEKISEEAFQDNTSPSSTSPSSRTESTKSIQTNAMEKKRELLLLFLLQHVARELNPDPMYFAQLAKFLLEEGVLTDKKYADFAYLKEQTKLFTREIMSFLPPISFHNGASDGTNTPGSPTEPVQLRRTGSVDSFLSAGYPLQSLDSNSGTEDSNYQQISPIRESDRLLAWVRNASAQHPLLDFLFSSPSRFRTDFIKKRKIGRGAFGNVYRAQHRIDGMDYAIKRIKFSFRNVHELETAIERVVREVKSLAQLSHPNIVRYNQAWFEPLRQYENDLEEREECEEEAEEEDFYGELTDNDNKDDDDDGDIGTEYGIEFEFDEEINSSETDENTPSTRIEDVDMDYTSGRIHQPFQHMHQEVDLHSFSPKDMSYLMYAMQKKSAPSLKLTPSPASPHHHEHHRSKANHSTPISNIKVQEPSTMEPQAVESLINKQSIEYVKSLLNEMFDQKKNKFEMSLYIQMELCSPSTLENYLWSDQRSKMGKLDLREVFMLFLQVCQAVDYIHSKGLIHRDIKPSNLFATDSDTLKLGDFGLAKIFHEMTAATDTSDEDTHTPGSAMTTTTTTTTSTTTSLTTSVSKTSSTHTSGLGTPTYASPEQLNDGNYDEKTDIFSLGLILFEMLHPFSTKTERAMVLSKVRRGVLPNLMLDAYPDEMALVKRCVDLDPARRPSARDVLHTVTNLMMKHGFSISSPVLTTGSSYSQSMSISFQAEPSTVSPSTPSHSHTSSSPEALLQQIQERDNEIDRLKKEIDQLRSTQT